MSSAVLDFDTLLHPIADDSPAGAELKEDSALSPLYYKVKDAREAARAAERNLQLASGDASIAEGLAPPDWNKVVDLATPILAEKSKDLWVAAWLIEGLARKHGFAGLRDGFRLTREMCEQYWENIHPRPDEDGVATTVAQLAGLNGQDSEGALIPAIDAIGLAPSPNGGELTGADYKQAAIIEQITDDEVKQQKIANGAKSLAHFEAAVKCTSADWFRERDTEIGEAIDEFERLSTVLYEKCGDDEYGQSAAPPSSNIRNALNEARDRLRGFARVALVVETPVEELSSDAESSSNGETVSTGDGPATPGKLRNRDDAFELLTRVADFFRTTEPHSPVSYSLEQAVRWGRMTLPELISELIGDSSVREDFFRRTGIGAQ